jgi:hypothetical protein
MSRRKKAKGKGSHTTPAVSGPFAGTYWHLRRMARSRDLFVLFDGAPEAPRLTFFDTARGLALLKYWPKSQLWGYADRPGRGGRCGEHADVIGVAVRRAGQRLKSDKSQFGTPA